MKAKNVAPFWDYPVEFQFYIEMKFQNIGDGSTKIPFFNQELMSYGPELGKITSTFILYSENLVFWIVFVRNNTISNAKCYSIFLWDQK